MNTIYNSALKNQIDSKKGDKIENKFENEKYL